MTTDERNGDGPGPVRDASLELQHALADAQRWIIADQTAADADQTSADADQAASETDQERADSDQRASDRDQATADHDRAIGTMTAADEVAYDASRDARVTTSFERLRNRLKRVASERERDTRAADRDRIAEQRDGAGVVRDALVADLSHGAADLDGALVERLEALAAQAAADRKQAAEDRARAAAERASAALERARLEEELRSAHLDELTGAFRREMGRLALSNEIDRARRSGAGFVLAFVDVDGLKSVNDRDGHAAGDRVLEAVVNAMRARLRSFDPILRYGGDEFVCGLGATDLAEAERRFEAIAAAIEADVGAGISVGLAALAPGDTVEQLTERADAAMLKVKEGHHSRR